jgi:hypothetical protein
MNTIVLNTLNFAVTEWDAAITSVSGNTAGGAHLFALAGETDNAAPIDARWVMPETDQGASLKKAVSFVYFEMAGGGEALVRADGEEYAYEIEPTDKGTVRARAGRGINAHRLGFGHKNLDGADFRIESIEPMTEQSKTRRIA